MVWPMPEMAQMAWSTRDQPEALRSWPFASDLGGGTKENRLVKLCVHKSSDAWLVESARKCLCLGTGIQISPPPLFFCKKKNKDLTEQLFGQEDVKSD